MFWAKEFIETYSSTKKLTAAKLDEIIRVKILVEIMKYLDRATIVLKKFLKIIQKYIEFWKTVESTGFETITIRNHHKNVCNGLNKLWNIKLCGSFRWECIDRGKTVPGQILMKILYEISIHGFMNTSPFNYIFQTSSEHIIFLQAQKLRPDGLLKKKQTELPFIIF